MSRVVCIGECMVELRAVAENTFARAYAGDVYNTAVYLKRSFSNAQVQFLTATGDDAMASAMRREWTTHGIDAALAFNLPGGSTGLYLIETDADGERSFQYWRHHSAARQWLALLLETGESVLSGVDIIYFSGISLAILSPGERSVAIELLSAARARGSRIAFDPNVRLRLWESAQVAAHTIRAAFGACDIALPSREDLAWVLSTDEPSRQIDLLMELGVSEAALTLGAQGCVIADSDMRVRLPAPQVAGVLDTSGAGDAFNGAYLANRLQGQPIREAAETALMIASRVVSHGGAIVPKSVSHPGEA